MRSKDYFVRSWRTMIRASLAQPLIAGVEGQPVAWALATSLGQVAAYKEGASPRERPVRGASELVQYEAMRWAIERGAQVYDMVGTPHSTVWRTPRTGVTTSASSSATSTST